jgi:hypothetical protein
MKPDKDLLGKWAVIRYYNGANPDTSIFQPASLVKFDKIDPEKFYWNGGQGFCVIGDSTELVEVYKTQPKTYKQEDRLWIRFMKKYHKVVPDKELSNRGGWISPEGLFYSCGHGEHAGLGRAICATILGVDETWVWLREQCWMYLYKDGTYYYESQEMPQPMLETVKKLSEIGEDKRWKERLSSLYNQMNKM